VSEFPVGLGPYIDKRVVVFARVKFYSFAAGAESSVPLLKLERALIVDPTENYVTYIPLQTRV
jgi:hypothetical protein